MWQRRRQDQDKQVAQCCDASGLESNGSRKESTLTFLGQCTSVRHDEQRVKVLKS